MRSFDFEAWALLCSRGKSLTNHCPGDQIKRGGWGSGPGEYTLSYKNVSNGTSATERMGFSGIDDELDAFVSLVRA